MKSDINNIQLKIGLKCVDNIPLVIIEGECDAFTASFTHGAILGLLKEGYKKIIIDISNLAFLDVAGFHALDDCCRLVTEAGGYMLLVNPGPQVAEVYEILRAQDSCKIVESIKEAFEKMKE